MSKNCRHCRTPLDQTFLDLGHAPPSNAYLCQQDLDASEVYYPLRLKVCSRCRLVQTEDYAAASEFFSSNYAYFSSTSTGWLEHAANYCTMITRFLDLDADSHVIEVASNDGYLLKNFVDAGIPCLGVEPTASTAAAARTIGIPVVEEFFGQKLAETLDTADLVIGNNVYAHVPDINDFTRGIRDVLKPEGVVTLEFPHIMRLVEFRQFDTVYHEHFSYLSLFAVERIFNSCGMRVFHVEELPTHGGSLRIFGCKTASDWTERESVSLLRQEEARRGIATDEYYADFQSAAHEVKNDFLEFLLQARRQGKSVAAYGAAAKGNTLINFAGIKPDLIPFVCDAADAKIGKYMPGSHIPILSPEVLQTSRPDYLVILPWNIAPEIKRLHNNLAMKGTQFVTAVPKLEIS